MTSFRHLPFAWLALIVGLALWHPAAAKGLLHTWTLDRESEAGHVLVPSGSAEGRGLSALILPDIPINGATPSEAFDAFITDQMKGTTNIHKRIDMPRTPFNGKILLSTSMHFTGADGEVRIVQFSANTSVDADSLRIVRADGPHNERLMWHFSGDVLVLAKRPDDAIAGKIERREHKAATLNNPTAKATSKPNVPKAAPIRPRADLVEPGDSVWGGQSWGFKTFNDAVRWWVRDFNNVISYNYYSITLYDPKALDGQSVGDWLKVEATGQEKHFHKTIERGDIKTWKPFWFSLYNVYEDENGNDFGAEYNAVQVGPGKVRMVRFLLTDLSYYKKEFRSQNTAVRKHMLKAADQAYIRPLMAAYDKELEDARRERERLAAEEAERKRIADEKEAERKRIEAETKAKRDAELATRWTAPGKGLKLSEIEAITHHTDFQTSTMGGVDVTTENWLLLKDGTAYYNPSIPPSDFNVEASRKVEPGRWSTWTKKNASYYRGANQKIPGATASPGKTEHISFHGRYIRAWGGIGMGGGFTSRSMSLSSNGRFYSSASNMMSGAGGGGASVYSSTGPDGKTSISSSAEVGYLLNRREVSNEDGASNRGTYAIDGYTIEFMTDSGRRRRWIYFELYEGAARVGNTDYIEEK